MHNLKKIETMLIMYFYCDGWGRFVFECVFETEFVNIWIKKESFCIITKKRCLKFAIFFVQIANIYFSFFNVRGCFVCVCVHLRQGWATNKSRKKHKLKNRETMFITMFISFNVKKCNNCVKSFQEYQPNPEFHLLIHLQLTNFIILIKVNKNIRHNLLTVL